MNTITFEELQYLQSFLNVDRLSTKEDTLERFKKSWIVNKKTTFEILFFLRDCRGGKGIRKQFYWVINYMARHHNQILIKHLNRIPYFGCWKDLWELAGTPVQQEVIDMYIAAIVIDREHMLKNIPVSFAAKWFPREKSTLDKEFDIVYNFSLSMNLAPSHIRKCFITPLRKYIGVCETNMSRGNWKSIDYNQQNSANYKYRKAFKKTNKEIFIRWREDKETFSPVSE
ncbi:hypothetical protein COB52_05230, partial [Candidatus Kaiserbacteria bacterium]